MESELEYEENTRVLLQEPEWMRNVLKIINNRFDLLNQIQIA